MTTGGQEPCKQDFSVEPRRNGGLLIVLRRTLSPGRTTISEKMSPSLVEALQKLSGDGTDPAAAEIAQVLLHYLETGSHSTAARGTRFSGPQVRNMAAGVVRCGIAYIRWRLAQPNFLLPGRMPGHVSRESRTSREAD